MTTKKTDMPETTFLRWSGGRMSILHTVNPPFDEEAEHYTRTDLVAAQIKAARAEERERCAQACMDHAEGENELAKLCDTNSAGYHMHKLMKAAHCEDAEAIRQLGDV